MGSVSSCCVVDKNRVDEKRKSQSSFGGKMLHFIVSANKSEGKLCSVKSMEESVLNPNSSMQYNMSKSLMFSMFQKDQEDEDFENLFIKTKEDFDHGMESLTSTPF